MSERLRILIVEDVAADAELEVREFRRAGIAYEFRRVETAAGYRQALDEFKPQVILSDFSMPQFDGMEALAIARQSHPHIPFIFVSGTLGEVHAVCALKNGATDYVIKSNLIRLPAAVERAISEAQERHARQEAERELHENESKYRELIEQASDGIYATDADGRFLLVNSHCSKLLGYAKDELIGRHVTEIYPENDRWASPERAELVCSGTLMRFERLVRRKDASVFPAEFSSNRLQNGTFQIIFRDITERRVQEKRISRLSRIHAVLSGITSASVRIRDRQELFNEACRIAVEHGELPMAWIGVVDRHTMKIKPVASAGIEQGFHTIIESPLSLRKDPRSRGIAAMAVTGKKPVIVNDIVNDPRVSSIRESHVERGIRSLAILPLLVAGDAVGVLALHAGVAGFFDDEEMKLLLELAGNLSFAMDYIEKEEKLDYLAYYDAITGLPNRSLFSERLSQYLDTDAKSTDLAAVVLMDVERFRMVNETLGRQKGDELLCLIARRLESNATVTRFSNPSRLLADAFAVVIRGARDVNELAHLLKAGMKACFGLPFVIHGGEFRIVARAGISTYPTDGADAESLLNNAESALKRAKQLKDRFVFYAPEMTARVAEMLVLETKLRKAIELEQFVLHYQPKFDVATGKITGVEALIRWNDPDTGMVPPARFIHVLEETGMIFEVGRWALRQALADQQRWRGKGLTVPRVAVNVSAQQLRDQKFVQDVQLALATHEGMEPALELEITESLVMEDIDRSIARLKALRELGVTIAIDDFGTGYSSLNYLARLPMDTLKIDRSFVTGMSVRPESRTIVSAIISLAHSLGLKVVAEGVETEEQLNVLRLLRCDEMQGFLLSLPVAPDMVDRFLFRKARCRWAESTN